MHMDVCGKCASYIIQLFNSGTEVADIEFRLPSPCVIADHIGCRSKHASFDVPEAVSTNVAQTEIEQRGVRSYQQAVSITSLSGLRAEMQDSQFNAVKYLLKRESFSKTK
jgi:hypothetical protein